MLPAPRLYQDEQDLAAMLALLQAGRAAGIPSYYPHVGDLRWWLYYPPLGSSWWQHIYLWEDPAGERLFGWALLEPHGETFDVYYQPALHGTPTAAAMLAWAEESAAARARAAGTERTGMYWVVPGDHFRIAWLEERGYRLADTDTALACSLAQPVPQAAVAEGFSVRRCGGLAEVEERARAQYGTFGSTAEFAAYVARFRAFMQSPAYAACTDWVAVDTDGRIAAFCLTWMDALNRVALFEPVGTHPDFRRKGLGSAVLRSALGWLRERGIVRAIVCTPHENTPAIGLYQSVGFQPYSEFRFYARKLD